MKRKLFTPFVIHVFGNTSYIVSWEDWQSFVMHTAERMRLNPDDVLDNLVRTEAMLVSAMMLPNTQHPTYALGYPHTQPPALLFRLYELEIPSEGF